MPWVVIRALDAQDGHGACLIHELLETRSDEKTHTRAKRPEVEEVHLQLQWALCQTGLRACPCEQAKESQLQTACNAVRDHGWLG